MQFLFGFIGALVVMLLFAAGVWAGWKAKEAMNHLVSKKTAPELSEQERLVLKAQLEAQQQLFDYGPEQAYGMKLTEESDSR